MSQASLIAFSTMDYTDGPSAAQYLARPPLEAKDLLAISIQLPVFYPGPQYVVRHRTLHGPLMGL